MKNTVSVYTLKKVVWSSVICILAFSSVFAANTKDVVKVNLNAKRTSSLVVENLTKILKADLVQENLSLQIANIEQTGISNNEVKLSGEATCILPIEKTQLPIKFEATVNLTKQSIDDLHYTFVESEYAPTSEEEILMKELMKQISRDYKTQEIVIAIDNFESSSATDNKTQYKGVGEVRIGEFEWSKINFDVVLGSEKSASKVLYKLQK